MTRQHLLAMALLVGLIACEGPGLKQSAYAQPNKTGLSQEDQKKVDDLINSAKRNEMIGYLAGGAGILLVAAAIPLSIYLDRRKKSRNGDKS